MPALFISCHGAGRRWQPPPGQGPPQKQLIEVFSETLLARMVRQARAAELDPVCVVAPGEPFRTPGAELLSPDPGGTACGCGKIDCARQQWPDGDLFVMFGDVFLTERSAARVFAFRSPRLTWIGRKRGSAIKKWGERFGAWIPVPARPELRRVCRAIRRDFGVLRGPRASAGTILKRLKQAHSPHNDWFEVNDGISDDFDRWYEWTRWRDLYAAGPPQ